MKTNYRLRHAVMCSIAALGLSSVAMAEPHSTTAAPPAPGDRPGMVREDRPMPGHDMKAAHDEMLRTTLGATVHPLPRENARQYDNLKPGVGLVVDDVQANSAAVTGGLKQGDVIFQVGDQWVINAPQLCTLLAIQDANDEFEIKVFRDGKRVDLDFKLDQAALDSMNRMHDEAAMASPESRTERQMSRDPVKPDFDNTRDNRMGTDRKTDDLAGVPAGQAGLIIPEKFDYKDDNNSYVLRTEDGSKKLTIKDDSGNVVFDGPYNTQADRDAVPADLHARFQKALRAEVK